MRRRGCAGAMLAGFLALGATACGGASIGGVSAAGNGDRAWEEAVELCMDGSYLDPGTQERLDRQLELDRFRLGTGTLTLDEMSDNLNRHHDRAQNDCVTDVEPLLRGPAGASAAGILRTARSECDAAGVPAGTRAFGDCIHARKLEIFSARHPEPDPRARETLDRLLALGGGAPLSPEARALYCRTRELEATGHPICDPAPLRLR